MEKKGWSKFVEQIYKKKDKLSFTDFLRVIFKNVLDPIGEFFNSLGIYPNTMTLIGFACSVVGSYLIATGKMVAGGIILLVGGPFDALDGTMARLRGEPEDFGAFVDSVTDRYIELFIYGGLLVHYITSGDFLGIGLVYAAAAGSIMVSYVKARAESLQFEAKVGILTRVERYLVLIPSLILGYPLVGIGILALGTNFTALHRIIHVRRQAHNK